MCDLNTFDECIDVICASSLLVTVFDGKSRGVIGYKHCTKLQCLLYIPSSLSTYITIFEVV